MKRTAYTPFGIFTLPVLVLAIILGTPFLWGLFVGLFCGSFQIVVTSR